MDHFAFLLIITLCSFAIATTENKIPRQYDPREENSEHIRFLMVEDGIGGYERIDLYETGLTATPIIREDLTFYLFTQQSRTKPDIITAKNFSALSKSHFVSSHPNVFLSHGWKNSVNSSVNTIVGPAILDRFNVNLFIIDWSRPANLNYFSARNAVPIIGGFVGDFINQMISTYNIRLAKFHLVGHSLGAHLVGCAGARVNGLVKSIVGLDPAGPLFPLSKINNRLDESDGEFVQVIHTNGGWLGMASALGHADYYPNGGRRQPGCGMDIAGSCAHSRAYELYAESILTSSFDSKLCKSMQDFNKNLCKDNQRSLMGHFHVDNRARGDYFLNTRARKPFAMTS